MPETRAEIRSHNPAGEVPDKTIAAKLIAAANRDKRITCRAAHEIAHELDCVPQKVGKTANLVDVRITRCQLGLFGRKETDARPLSKDNITREMETAMATRVLEGNITCADCWRLADQLRISRLETGALCDALRIKVLSCQLGAFR